MSIRRTLYAIILLTLIGVALSLWAYPQLPEMVPSHWNAAGEIDDYMPRGTALILMPAVILGLGLLLLYIPNIDPLRANVEHFRETYNWMVIGICAFMLFMHLITLLAGMGMQINILYLMIPAMALLFLGMGFLIERAEPNWFIGIRTPWTLSSPTVWAKTHQLGGLMFKGSAALMLVGLFFPPEVVFWFILIPLLLSAIVTIAYSYVLYRDEQA